MQGGGRAALRAVAGELPLGVAGGGFERQRPAGHLIAVFERAAEGGVFRDLDLAAARVTDFVATLAP